MPPPTMNALPSEILHSIFYYLPPQSLASLQSTSKRLKALVEEPLLWRYNCRVHYKYWAADHAIEQKLAGPVAEVDWHGLFKQRWCRDREIAGEIDGIVAVQQKRIVKMANICESGYDAKDELLRQASVGEEVEDHLARSWWSEAALGLIQRRMALEVWQKLSRGEDVPLEHALGAFDMFTVGSRNGDLWDISATLDDMVAQFREKTPEFEEFSTRQKALALVQFLRDSGFEGVQNEARDYHAMQNNFIGFALRDSRHQTLPIILTSIYICLARRIGVDARASNVPLHIYGVVFAPSGKTLDHKPTEPDAPTEYMFIDPFRHANEVSVSDVQHHLAAIGISPSSYAEFTTVASTRDLVIRTTRNIMTSAQTMRERELIIRVDDDEGAAWANGIPQVDEAYYAALWAMLIVQTSPPARRARIMPWLLEKIQPQYPWDVVLLEDVVLPMFLQGAHNMENGGAFIFAGHGRGVRQVKGGTEKVRFRVGSVFKHRRYGYEGVIVGWDTKCEKDEGWIAQMGVRRLSGGSDQSFYNVLAADKSSRYVAEENIDIMTSRPSKALMMLAGRYFKRWDSLTGKFVSNIRDEYPDD
ncbi:hypothetical protein NA57DRAFT_43038 [Rhizodiscina lignyota]|uniref:F-box domain-containing protein n=1 Tax=Rhizodiscina lignyota TaxID=1504668 RepID=A0A9P4IBR0_9PEZI|nr:hypothetical protein NA57DRAFT_43038 [Rhizodiscina lignyota]